MKEESVVIRRAQPGDEEGIHRAHMRSINEICVKEHGDEVKGWGSRPLGERWKEAIVEGNVWVIEAQSQIKGLAYLRISSDNSKVAYLHALYLTPEVVGQGLADQLMRLMLKTAKNNGCEIIELESSITAHNFYKKYGFEDFGEMKYLKINGYPVTCYPMRLKTLMNFSYLP